MVSMHRFLKFNQVDFCKKSKGQETNSPEHIANFSRSIDLFEFLWTTSCVSYKSLNYPKVKSIKTELAIVSFATSPRS